MMVRGVAIAAALSMAFLAHAGGGTVAWERSEVAGAKSAATGKPVCYYFLNDAVVLNGST